MLIHFLAGGRLGHGMRSGFFLMLLISLWKTSRGAYLWIPYWAADVVIVLAFSAAISASKASILSYLVVYMGLWAVNNVKIWKVSISKSELVGYGFWTVTDEVGPRITSILSLVVWLLTIAIGSEEAPIRCPAVGALELIADIATPVTILSNYAQIVLARSDHFCTLVCFLCHLLYLLFFHLNINQYDYK